MTAMTHCRLALQLIPCTLALGLWLGSAERGRAEPERDEAAELATARALAIEGVQLAQAHRCDEAVPTLERAEAIHHAPVVLFYLASCHVEVGRFVQGCEVLRQLLSEPQPPHASRAVEDAYQRGAQLLSEVQPRIATLTIALDAPAGSAPTVQLDGAEIGNPLLGVARAIDPGEHLIRAQGPGLSSIAQKIIIAPGQTRAVSLALQRLVLPRRSVAASQPNGAGEDFGGTRTASSAAQDGSPGMRLLPAYVAWGVGAAGLALGIAYGVTAMRGSNALETHCPNHICPAAEQGRLSSERTHATISTIGFAAAAAGALAGTVLYVIAKPPDDVAPARATSRTQRTRTDTTRAHLSAGPLGVQLDLAF